VCNLGFGWEGGEAVCNLGFPYPPETPKNTIQKIDKNRRTDTRANRLAAPDYIYIRLVIASMFVRLKKNAAATNSFAIRRFRASSPLIQRMHFFN
jgi:hypothetical protein